MKIQKIPNSSLTATNMPFKQESAVASLSSASASLSLSPRSKPQFAVLITLKK